MTYCTFLQVHWWNTMLYDDIESVISLDQDTKLLAIISLVPRPLIEMVFLFCLLITRSGQSPEKFYLNGRIDNKCIMLKHYTVAEYIVHTQA